MPRLYLIRHGEAEAAFDAALDPGLSPRGQGQAEEIAARLEALGPLALFTSPLKRARETVAPLERTWRLCARIEPRIAEIPSPSDDPAARGPWRAKRGAGTCPALDDQLACRLEERPAVALGVGSKQRRGSGAPCHVGGAAFGRRHGDSLGSIRTAVSR